MLQIRATIRAKGLDEEKVRQRLALKITDLPLTYDQFEAAIKYFEPNFSEYQMKKLFSKLADSSTGKVSVIHFLRNVAGSDQETVEGQKSMYKALYNEIYRKGKE